MRSVIDCWRNTVVCLSVLLRRSVMGLNVNDISYSMCLQRVNRKCPLGTRFYNFQTSTLHRIYSLKLPPLSRTVDIGAI